jgi:uncharacterized phage protein (TIGR01671 family)
MREHKYRIWDEKNKEFVYFNLRRLVGHWSGIVFDPEEPSTQSNGREGIAGGEYDEVSLLGTAPLDEFTGRTDKNGKEIYERDIVEKYAPLHTATDELSRFVNIIEWNTESSGGGWSWVESGVKVIGNIYENPELLEK